MCLGGVKPTPNLVPWMSVARTRLFSALLVSRMRAGVILSALSPFLLAVMLIKQSFDAVPWNSRNRKQIDEVTCCL